MLVAIEGVDGSGKTHLYNQLKNLGYEVVTIQEPDYANDWIDLILQCAKENKNLICDRCFISDVTYRLWDDKPRRGMTFTSMCYLLGSMKVIYCKTETQFSDSMKRGENLVTTKNDSDKISKYYDIVLKLLTKFQDVKICKYDWQHDSIDKVIKFIEEA